MANELYPIFLKANELQILVVGGGFVGLEKISFLLKSSPRAKITLVSLDILPELQLLLNGYSQVIFLKKAFDKNDLIDKDLVIAATSIKSLNK